MDSSIIIQECTFKAVRSSGAGGQHVNKVSSKIEMSFDVQNSKGLTEEEKLKINEKLSNRITKSGLLLLQCSESRSQHKNKNSVIKRFLLLLKVGLIITKKRKKTKIPRRVKFKRLKNKRKLSDKKQERKKQNFD